MPKALDVETIKSRLQLIRPMLYKGLTAKEIGRQLGLTNVSSFLNKYGNESDRQLMRENWLRAIRRDRAYRIGFGEQVLFEALLRHGFRSGHDFVWQYQLQVGENTWQVDFYFPQWKLAVDVSCTIERVGNTPQDAFWIRNGYKVVRVGSVWCSTNPDEVVRMLLEIFK